jgi:hypothetical protein
MLYGVLFVVVFVVFVVQGLFRLGVFVLRRFVRNAVLAARFVVSVLAIGKETRQVPSGVARIGGSVHGQCFVDLYRLIGSSGLQMK